MPLKCGIIGIANVGKTTLFNCMSTTKGETGSYAFSSSKSNIGVISVPDDRLKTLEKFQSTDRLVPATVEIVDIPGLTKGSSKGEGVGNKFLADIRNTDALIHVLRCFDDQNLPHIDGSVNPARDIETIDLELQIRDLESVEKKFEKLEKIAKIGDKDAKKGVDVLARVREHLGNMQNLRDLELDDNEKSYIDDLFLLTVKPILYVCNVDDASAFSGNSHSDQVKRFLEDKKSEILVIAGKLEAEIAELEESEDRMAFLQDAGLSEPGVNKVIRSAYASLNLISFFTMGPKEIRAWTIKKGMNAQQAAGAIHSDLERGFIRAEVMKYQDFIELGSEHKVREAGKFHIEGKQYIVDDGDILHIRFNV
jgi:GTP-binding protein YchF